MIRARAGDGQPDPTLAELREALTRGLDLRAEYMMRSMTTSPSGTIAHTAVALLANK
jgi:hypothetical protein